MVRKVKIGIVVAALAAAVSITLLSGEDHDSLAGIDTHTTVWKCKACALQFDLSWSDARDAEKKSGGVPIHCVDCSKVQAYPLSVCLRCATLFVGPEVPGGSALCPKCPRPAKPSSERPVKTSDEQEDESIEFKKKKKRVAPKSF